LYVKCGIPPPLLYEKVTAFKHCFINNNRLYRILSGYIYFSNAKDKSVVIYDFNGNVVQHSMTRLDETTTEISLSTYAEGLYFVRVMGANGNSVQTSKIILTH